MCHERYYMIVLPLDLILIDRTWHKLTCQRYASLHVVCLLLLSCTVEHTKKMNHQNIVYTDLSYNLIEELCSYIYTL